MDTTNTTTTTTNVEFPGTKGGGLTDVPLILEDLLCQIEDLRATGGDDDVIADLLAQVELLQGR